MKKTYEEVIENKLSDLYKRLGEMDRAGYSTAAKFVIRLQIDLLEDILSEVAKAIDATKEERLLNLQEAILKVEGIKVPRKQLENMSCTDISCEQRFYDYLLEK